MEEAVYDKIARQYRRSKQLPFRIWVERYTLLRLCGKVEGLSVLDLACGEGTYTRLLQSHGAALTHGIDVSGEMIALAQSMEVAYPLGCHYATEDVGKLQKRGDYDLALGMLLLNYARSAEELLRFLRAAFVNLRPGGRFIGINDNPMQELFKDERYRKYGLLRTGQHPLREGDPIRYTLLCEGEQFGFDNYYLAPSTYENAFRKAGFVDFRWHGPFLDPAAAPQAFWMTFMSFPPIVGFCARKPDTP